MGRASAWPYSNKKFSKLSSLPNRLFKNSVELMFENFYYGGTVRWGAQVLGLSQEDPKLYMCDSQN